MGGMRRALIAAVGFAAGAIALAVFWPDDPGVDPGGPLAESPAAEPRSYVNENGEAAPRPTSADAGRGVTRVRLMGPDGPVTKAVANLFLASGWSHHGRRLPSARGEPDADGWVVFSKAPAPADAPKLHVYAPFFAFFEAPFIDGATVTLTALPPMRGRVLMPDKSPAAGAVVGNEDEPLVKTVADARGAFTLATPYRGSLIADRDGLSARLDRAPADGVEIELILAAGPQAQGQVVGRDTKPIPGVAIEIRAGALSRATQTGPDGRWSSPMFGGARCTVTFTKDGYQPVVNESVSTGAEYSLEQVVMSRPSIVTGTLVTADGRPVPDTVVTSNVSADATTDADGRFTFEDVGYAEVILEAEVEEGGLARKHVAVPEGTTVEVTLMVPPVLIQVPLDVVDVTGEPNSAWDAVATPVPAKGWESHASYGAGDGIGLTQGRFQISVRDEERELSGGTTVDVSPAVDKRPIHIVLIGADGGRGKRLPTDRDPIARVKVQVVTEAGGAALTAEVECGGSTARALGNGEFECPFYEDEAGAIVVTAEVDDARAAAHVTIDQKLVKLTLRPARIIRGTIVGTVPTGAYLEINSAAEMDEVPISSNTFLLEGRPALRTAVCLVSGGVSKGCALAGATGDVVLEIPMGDPQPVTLTVVDEKGKPVANPILYIDRRGSRPEAPEGKASVPVVPGTHVLVVNAEGSKARAELQFAVKPGAPVDLGTIRLK